MNRDNVEKVAFDHFLSGFHCAEAVTKTIIESYVENPDPEVVKLASGFVGGIGGTHVGTCGALTGGIVAVGALYGRSEPGADYQHARELATAYALQFEAEFGATSCGVLLDGFGEQVNGLQCKQLTAKAAGMLSELLVENDERREGVQSTCGCACN